MCFVFIWEQAATYTTYIIKWLDFITERKSVYSAVRIGYLNKAVCASSLKGQGGDGGMTLTGDNKSTGRKKPVLVPFVHHKSHMDWRGIEPGIPAVGGRRITAWAMKISDNFLPQAPRFPRQHCFWGVPQVTTVCPGTSSPSTKVSAERWWNGSDWWGGTDWRTGDNLSQCHLCPPQTSHTLTR